MCSTVMSRLCEVKLGVRYCDVQWRCVWVGLSQVKYIAGKVRYRAVRSGLGKVQCITVMLWLSQAKWALVW